MRRRYVVIRTTKLERGAVEKLRETALKLFGLCSLAPSLKSVNIRGMKEGFIIIRTTNEALRQVVAACTLTPLEDDGVLRVVGVTGSLAKAREIANRVSGD